MNEKPNMGLWGITVMSMGFFGIQFGWGLQMANMSAIYNILGASPDQIPILWIAAPLTGLLVQPFVGKWSDRTWGKLGRRKPYFLGGAIVATSALFFMPHCTAIWMAAIMLWLLDGSVNVSMGPFRAYVADNLNKKQMTLGYSVQSILIAIGTILSSCLPFILNKWFHISGESVNGQIPDSIRYAFYIGGSVFFLAVLWTVLKGKEYPPEDMEAFKKMKAEKVNVVGDLFKDLLHLPKIMKQLAWVQFFSWMGLFSMFMYFAPTVGKAIFKGAPGSHAYTEGVAWAGVCFAIYAVVSFFASFIVPVLCKYINRKFLYMIMLLCGAAGLIGIYFMNSQYQLIWSMIGIGIMYTAVMIIPYAILGDNLPSDKMGVYMGVFNLFITLPEIVMSLLFGMVMYYILGQSEVLAVVTGGVFMIISALCVLGVNDSKKDKNEDIIPETA